MFLFVRNIEKKHSVVSRGFLIEKVLYLELRHTFKEIENNIKDMKNSKKFLAHNFKILREVMSINANPHLLTLIDNNKAKNNQPTCTSI